VGCGLCGSPRCILEHKREHRNRAKRRKGEASQSPVSLYSCRSASAGRPASVLSARETSTGLPVLRDSASQGALSGAVLNQQGLITEAGYK
jgi:hypothetical protein